MIKEIVLTGKTISYGVAHGRVCLGQHGIPMNVPKLRIRSENIETELRKLDSALKLAIKDLKAVKAKVQEEIGKAESEIFETHILILKDPNIVDLIKHNIKDKRLNVEWSISNSFDVYIQKFEEIENEFFRERSHDLVDIKHRLLDILLTKEEYCSGFYGCKRWGKKIVIACKTLLPSLVTKLNKKTIMAIVVEEEVTTSHAAIISKALGIPVLCGVDGLVDHLYCGGEVIVDADKARVIIAPSEKTLQAYKHALKDSKRKKAIIKDIILSKSFTEDGYEIKLYSNIGYIDQIKSVSKYRSLGVGLLRTEFVFFQKYVAPSEEEQMEIYEKIIRGVGKKRTVTFRVLDVGGDKTVKYLNTEEEENPYLGIRGIRFLLRECDFFKTQLRALLRLSHLGKFRIMYPMISNFTELVKIKELVREIVAELALEDYEVQEGNIEHGIMIEVPSTVLMLENFLPEVDFASIGTNDLLQYTIAVDRNHRGLTSVYNKLSPALLKIIKMAARKCKKAGKPLSICGEIAGNPRYTLPLIGLGLTEFSMTSSLIPYVKDVILNNSMKKAVRLANKLMKMNDSNDVEDYLSMKANVRKILN